MAKAGAVITCLLCSKDVYKLNKDVSSNELLSAKDFQGIKPYDSPKDDTPAVCPACGFDLIPSVMRTINEG